MFLPLHLLCNFSLNLKEAEMYTIYFARFILQRLPASQCCEIKMHRKCLAQWPVGSEHSPKGNLVLGTRVRTCWAACSRTNDDLAHILVAEPFSQHRRGKGTPHAVGLQDLDICKNLQVTGWKR